MATFKERAAHSVNQMFLLLRLFVDFSVSHSGFEGVNLALLVLVPGHCLPFTFHVKFPLLFLMRKKNLEGGNKVSCSERKFCCNRV